MGRVPHVRPSVRGPKTMDAQQSLLTLPFSSRASWKINGRLPVPVTQARVPHISLVFREMWDTTILDVQLYRLS
jgi:hypothetical protein